MERYTTLKKENENLYTDNCPVLIVANALVKDNDTNKVFAQLKFKNISDSTIKAVKVEIISYSVEKEELPERTEAQYLDLTATYNEEFGQKQPVFLPHATARSYKIICKSVVFADGKWENKNNFICQPNKYPQGVKKSITDTKNFTNFISFAEQEEIKANTNIFWQNHDKEQINKKLYFLKEKAMYADSDLSDEVNNAIEQYTKILCSDKNANDDFTAEEQEMLSSFEKLKSELEASEKTYHIKKSRRNKKIITVLCASVAVCVAFVFVFTIFINPALKYNKAIKFMNNGNYDYAIAVFTDLEYYKDSENYISESKYLKAKDFMNKCNYDAAAKLFVELGNYKDSTEQLEECSYQLNEAAYQNAISYFNAHRNDLISSGIYSTALNLFSKLNGYKDSNQYKVYILGSHAESNSIRDAYDYYINLPTTFLDVSERLKLIEQYLPYTGTYTYKKGNGASGGYKEVYISISDSNKIEIHFSGGEDYTLVKSDDSNYDYKFDNYYISKNMLYCNNNYYNTQTYFAKDTW